MPGNYMPFVSEAQRRFLWATHPRLARKWADKYGTPKNLPYHVKKANSDAAVGAALLTLSLPFLIYDTYHAWGVHKTHQAIADHLQGKTGAKMVHVAKHVAKSDPKVKVVDSAEAVNAFCDKEIPADIRELVRPGLLQVVEKGSNAAAFRSKDADYIIGQKHLPLDVVEHELGHIRDFREKGITTGNGTLGEYSTGLLDHISQLASKTRFMKGRYRAETEAWDRAKIPKGEKSIKEEALRSYEQSFHLNRIAVAFPFAVVAGSTLLQGMAKTASAPLAPLLSKEKRKSLSHADSFFAEGDSSRKWKEYDESLARKSFAKTLAADPRADEKLRIHADKMNRLKTGKVVATVPGDSGNTYEIRALRGGGLGCTCQDWRFKKSLAMDGEVECKHMRRHRESANKG